MGLNIILRREDGMDHPDWDFLRYSGDDEIARLFGKLPTLFLHGDQDSLYRPTQFDVWRSVKLDNTSNPARLPHMLDILEREPDVWVCISY